MTPPKVIANTGYSFEAKAGYEYDGWDRDFSNLKADTDQKIEIKGKFTKLDDISDTAYPGYVEVILDSGADGSLKSGKTKAYVNPHANKTVKDVLEFTETEITPDIGKSFDGWDQANDVEITSGLTITAVYGNLEPISTSPQPGYVQVDFEVDNAETNKGEIPSSETSTYYINPTVPVTLTDKAPGVTAKTGFDHTGWDIDMDREQIYFKKTMIKATFAAKDDYYTVDTPGYVKVTFALDDDSKGSLEEETVFWVNPNKTVTLPAPSVNENTGYKFKEWDTNFTDRKFDSETIITGSFTSLDDISPVQYPGYVKVTFDKGDQGKTIEGTTVYYVNSNKQVDLTNVADQIKITPEIGFNHTGWENLTGPFTGETTIKATYNLIADVIPVTDPATIEKPAGYKELKFSPGQGGLLDGTSLYYVNPTKNITLDHEDIKVPEPKQEEGYTFDKWLEPLDKTEVIDKDKHFWANFVLSEYRVTYTSTDDSINIPVDPTTYKAGDKARVASEPDRPGYTFKGWYDGTKTYQPGDEIEVQKDGITLTALWEEIDIVDGDEEKPSEEFVTVTFTGGDHGQVTSTGPGFSGDGKDRVFKVHVRKNKVVDLSDLADAITIKAYLGYGFDGWKPRTPMGAFDLASLSINTDLTIDAQYETLPDTIAVDDPANPPTKPEDYVEVVFTGGQGSNLQGSQT